MTRGVFNWNYYDVVDFLKERGFTYIHAEGSHHVYAGRVQGKGRLVYVQFHGTRAIKPRTLKTMILQSGIPKKEWLGG